MTPNKRLDQLEPVIADVLQKVDRLIEGQGQLVEVVTDTKAELDQVKITGGSTARALANLTVCTQKEFEQIKIRFERLETNQTEMHKDVNEMRQDITDLKAGQELILKILQDKLR